MGSSKNKKFVKQEVPQPAKYRTKNLSWNKW